MGRIVFVLLLFALAAAYGQMQDRVAIINTLDDRDSIGFSELAYLTDRLRETAVNVLPKSHYGVMTTESIVAFLGSQEKAVKACKEASCLAELGRKVSADYVAQARIGRFEGDFTIKMELYNSKSGNLIGSFTGSSKNMSGFLAIVDEKASVLFKKLLGTSGESAVLSVAKGISGFEKAADYELGGGKRYLVNLSTEPSGAILSFYGVPASDCPRTPCKIKLGEGTVRIVAALEQHETVDTTVSVAGNNQSIAIRLKPNFGVLEIKPAYIDGIGEYDDWDLSINDKIYDSFENKFSPGNYNVKLSHKCYELMSFMVGISKGGHEVFDMAGHITLKKGGLDLSAERNGEPAIAPVFVNGKQAGETPFSGAVPLCSKIEIGENRGMVSVSLKHNDRVSHKVDLLNLMPFYRPISKFRRPIYKTSFWVALGLDLLGVAFIGTAISENGEMHNGYKKYSKSGMPQNYYDDRWEKAEDHRSSRNMFYVIGGVVLASGIGVHIWF